MWRAIALFVLSVVLGVLTFGCVLARAAAPDAVVLIRSHGGSGTVIWTSGQKTYVLSAAHMFAGEQRRAPVKLECPFPQPGTPRPGGARCIGVDAHADLALVEVNLGPMPYVCPVAREGHQAGNCLSVGFDDLKWPGVRRPAHLSNAGFTRMEPEYTPAWRWPWGRGGGRGPLQFPGHDDSAMQWTEELPWFGRSGGGLLDVEHGVLIGVCSGFTGTDAKHWSEVKPGAKGRYTNLAAVRNFVGRTAPEALTPCLPGILEFPLPPRPSVQEWREPLPVRPSVQEWREPNPTPTPPAGRVYGPPAGPLFRPACPPSV